MLFLPVLLGVAHHQENHQHDCNARKIENNLGVHCLYDFNINTTAP